MSLNSPTKCLLCSSRQSRIFFQSYSSTRSCTVFVAEAVIALRGCDVSVAHGCRRCTYECNLQQSC